MNKITARIEFSFKGQDYKPSAELDLDQIMQKHHAIPPLHQHLALLNNIDSYSYEYEMLFSEEIIFTDAQGDVTSFINNNQFQQADFEAYWLQQALLEKLAPSIKQQLDIDNINQHPKLKAVIISAYKIGADSQK